MGTPPPPPSKKEPEAPPPEVSIHWTFEAGLVTVVIVALGVLLGLIAFALLGVPIIEELQDSF